MLKHPTKHKKTEYTENPHTVSMYTKIIPTIQTNDDRHTHTHTHKHQYNQYKISRLNIGHTF